MRFPCLGTAGLILAGTLLAVPALEAQAYLNWRPVDPRELAQKEPLVDKDAPAEAIFWDVHVRDEFAGGYGMAVQEHYLRIKIFTEAGKTAQGQVELSFGGKTNISGVAARTIRPDGKVVPPWSRARSWSIAGGRRAAIRSRTTSSSRSSATCPSRL
jgi:hypothetical protein